MLPNFLIIGAQKSASTFIQECLKEHDEVYMPDGEIPFFETPDYEKKEGNLNILEELCDDKSSCNIYGIKRPNYLGKPEVPKRIADYLPNAKLIVVLRDPVKRAASSYYHNIKYGFIPALNIEDGMRKILHDKIFLEKYPRASEILTFGLYAQCLDRYFSYFSKDQILILFHEEILKDPVGSVERTYDFLGVNPNHKPKALNTRPQAVVYNINRLKFLRLRNKLIFTYEYNHTRLSQKKINGIAKFSYLAISGIDKYLLSKILGNKRPEISESLRSMLGNYYHDDVNRLEKLVGKDLSGWK